jgi:uncharacterized repeat protein (TIGR03803 family)
MKSRQAAYLASALVASLSSGLSQAGTLTTLHSFSGLSDGATPLGSLLWLNGSLFGTAEFGGQTDTTNCPDGCGVVFKMNPKTGKETVLYSFQGGSDGTFPSSAVLASNDLIYGTTSLGGGQVCFNSDTGCGTVFQLDPATGQETILYPFGSGGMDGEIALSGVTPIDDVLYGTTVEGGASQVGNIYALNLDGNVGSNLYSFTGYPGDEFPEAGLVAVNGTLYGTTAGIGEDFGTVFGYSLSSGTETIVHQFSGQDGERPSAGMIALDGALYGTTLAGGGPRGAGTVFRIDLSTGAESVVYSFTNSDGDGAAPMGALIAVGHKLYGTTEAGGNRGCTGNQGCGTIFEVNPANGKEAVLYRFTGGSDEGNPQAGLVYRQGAFYGTTARNGSNSCYNGQGCGTVFKFVR